MDTQLLDSFECANSTLHCHTLLSANILHALTHLNIEYYVSMRFGTSITLHGSIMQILNSNVWTNSLPEYNWNWLIKDTLTFWDWREIQHIAIYFDISVNIQCSTDYFCYLYNGVLIHNSCRASLGQHLTELLLRRNVLNDGAKWPNQVNSRLFSFVEITLKQKDLFYRINIYNWSFVKQIKATCDVNLPIWSD